MIGSGVFQLLELLYKKVTDLSSFDISNKGHDKGSACLATAFLKEFVPCSDWMDITMELECQLHLAYPEEHSKELQ